MKFLYPAVLATLLLTPLRALAAETDAGSAPAETPARQSSSALHADAETDPTAFVLSGYSLHVGLGYRRVRLDLGAYAMAVPRFVHQNEDFDLSFDGFGAKLQFFPFEEQKGAFVGVDTGVTRARIDRRGSEASERQTQLGVGIHAGWRISLPAGFYATPWIGVAYAFGAEDVTLGGATFRANPITVFPAIHLGYRFR